MSREEAQSDLQIPWKDERQRDLVEVVRCKDCKWSDWYKSVDGNCYCYCMETGAAARTEDDYCSYGEKQDG